MDQVGQERFMIPEQRSKSDIIFKIALSGVLVAVGAFLTPQNGFYYTHGSVTLLFFALAIIEIVLRIGSLYEEYNHLYTRYHGKVLPLLKATMACNTYTGLFILISVCNLPLVYMMQGDPINYLESHGIVPVICAIGAVYIISRIIKVEHSPLNFAINMNDLKGLDYGSGMAYSFFYGYLNILLPHTGDERKGLREHILDYEAQHHVEFAVKKLFIFIPRSAYCPTTITNVSRFMEACPSLESRKMDRAGVKQRVYHNSVYKVWRDRTFQTPPVYVCAEYATPLLTLFEVMSQNTPESRRYNRYKTEIINNFYTTLKNIIESNRDCRNLCELIYYNDVDVEGHQLTLEELDVGRMLLERVDQASEEDHLD